MIETAIVIVLFVAFSVIVVLLGFAAGRASIEANGIRRELAALKADYKANLDRMGVYAKDGAHDRGVMREALKWYASNLRGEDRLNDNGERAAKALAKVKEFERKKANHKDRKSFKCWAKPSTISTPTHKNIQHCFVGMKPFNQTIKLQ